MQYVINVKYTFLLQHNENARCVYVTSDTKNHRPGKRIQKQSTEKFDVIIPRTVTNTLKFREELRNLSDRETIRIRGGRSS